MEILALDGFKLKVEGTQKIFTIEEKENDLSYIYSHDHVEFNIISRRPSKGFHNMPDTLQRGVKKSLRVVFL